MLYDISLPVFAQTMKSHQRCYVQVTFAGTSYDLPTTTRPV